MNKIILLIIVVGVLLVGGFWLMQKGKIPAPSKTTTTQIQTQALPSLPNDTTQSISQDLNSVDTGANLDQEFQSIDKDVNAL